ncbi:MAG: hypothetical protein OZSIB_1791 [Candidatus Ozemobacter sibiricus]|jgi:hypothetical protein|uniref:Uncharacterized protein n=1 Tax=Candidatus Ozemobacter sibiricus TaxID=2268124 RepID=A0A367ZL61_9BACT|nr:MAG: hypothetical protein OZSIB_1791 [Candidatus Ozemobacter sibiricus]
MIIGRQQTAWFRCWLGLGLVVVGMLVAVPAAGADPVGEPRQMQVPVAPDADLLRDCRPFDPATRPAVRRSERVIVDGVIAEVSLGGPAEAPSLVGHLRLRRSDGEMVEFAIYELTLILIRDRQGKLWVGRLSNLRPGWECSVAYGLPNDEDEEIPDKNPTPTVIDADNLIATVPPQ